MVDRQRYKEIWKEEYRKVFSNSEKGEKPAGEGLEAQSPTTTT